MEVDGSTVTMVALDGFRMAVRVASALNDQNFKAVIRQDLVRNIKY